MANALRIGMTSGLVGSKDGAGRLDYSNAQYGAWRWWNGDNGAFFLEDADSDGRKEINFAHSMSAGVKYHVFISWLVDGQYVEANLVPNMDIDLNIYAPSGGLLASSISTSQNYEAVGFTAPTTGTYRVCIERYSNLGGGDVVLGSVIRAR